MGLSRLDHEDELEALSSNKPNLIDELEKHGFLDALRHGNILINEDPCLRDIQP